VAGAIPTAPSFVAGERVTASKMNALTSLANWPTDVPMFHLYLSANIDMGTTTPVTWTSNLSSLSNMSVSLPAAFVPIPYTGIWEFTFQVSVASQRTDTTSFYWYLYLASEAAATGSQVGSSVGHRHTAGTGQPFQFTTRTAITAGQYVYARTSTSDETKTLASGSRGTYLEGRLIARP